jgi:hypothetical protein
MSQQERWQVSGKAAEAYERYMVPTLFTPLAHDLIAPAALRPGERGLDVACGTGIVARLAAGYVDVAGHFVGVDVNPGMLAVARAQTPASASARVQWTSARILVKHSPISRRTAPLFLTRPPRILVDTPSNPRYTCANSPYGQLRCLSVLGRTPMEGAPMPEARMSRFFTPAVMTHVPTRSRFMVRPQLLTRV